MTSSDYRLPDGDFQHAIVYPKVNKLQINNTPSTVKLTHIPSGNSVTCDESRSPLRNAHSARMQLEALLLDA